MRALRETFRDKAKRFRRLQFRLSILSNIYLVPLHADDFETVTPVTNDTQPWFGMFERRERF